MQEQTESLLIGDLMAMSGVGFGTSGARGRVEAMTDRVCYAYTLGFVQYLERANQIQSGGKIALAGDYRSSTPRIMAAAGRAVQDLGYCPINCGFIPSPAVAAYGMGEGNASLMVTGSHIPDDRNGIKFNTPHGEISKDDEAAIKAQRVDVPATLFDSNGGFREPSDLPPVEELAYRRYCSRYLDFFPPDCLRGMRVLVYEHSSVAREPLAEVLRALGAEVLPRGLSEKFVPVDTEAIRPQDVALARQWGRAEDIDAIVSADGDGDRPLIGDESGEWFRGDLVGVLTARFLNADRVVTPVSSNTALEASGWFDATLRTRIGSPFVIAAMAQAAAVGGRRVVGFEANGGFLTWQDLYKDGKSLPALPTRDAIIVILSILVSARSQNLNLSALRASLPARYTASDRLQDFPTDLSRRCIADLRDGGAPAIEAQFPALGELIEIDETDGLRMTFGTGEIVHLRPSGNAPELRCYNEAASAERAAVLNAECMALLARWRRGH